MRRVDLGSTLLFECAGFCLANYTNDVAWKLLVAPNRDSFSDRGSLRSKVFDGNLSVHDCNHWRPGVIPLVKGSAREERNLHGFTIVRSDRGPACIDVLVYRERAVLRNEAASDLIATRNEWKSH